MNTKNNNEKSFFEQFSKQQIFQHWNNCDTLLELAQTLGFTGTMLSRRDYEYINSIKDRTVWPELIRENREKERSRPTYVKQLTANDLQTVLNSDGIETLKHLALHFLLSEKHGRKVLRKCILDLQFSVKDELHKGLFGVSKEPIHYPRAFYEKRKGKKPLICPKCSFHAVNPQQIEIHHQDDADKGPKNARSPSYYRSPNVEVLCRNCHTLEHRTGEKLQAKCGKWRPDPPGNINYKNPDEIFSLNCRENYRMQKNYFLKWILRGPSD